MLIGDKVILRPLQIDDWHASVKWRNNAVIKKQAMLHPFPITDVNEKEWYTDILSSKSNKLIYFTITTLDYEPIGFISLQNINYIHRNCYLGIVIGEESFRGKGYGKESVKLILDYAFSTLNMHKVLLEVLADNIPAINLYEKMGFEQEGLLKSHFFFNQKYHNIVIMSNFTAR